MPGSESKLILAQTDFKLAFGWDLTKRSEANERLGCNSLGSRQRFIHSFNFGRGEQCADVLVTNV